MKAAWKYIQEHHEEYGIALFIVPALLCALAAIGAAYGPTWLLQCKIA